MAFAHAARAHNGQPCRVCFLAKLYHRSKRPQSTDIRAACCMEYTSKTFLRPTNLHIHTQTCQLLLMERPVSRVSLMTATSSTQPAIVRFIDARIYACLTGHCYRRELERHCTAIHPIKWISESRACTEHIDVVPFNVKLGYSRPLVNIKHPLLVLVEPRYLLVTPIIQLLAESLDHRRRDRTGPTQPPPQYGDRQ